MKSIATTIAVLIAAHSLASAQSAPSLPKDAETLRKSYLEAKQRATQPLDQKYKADLEKLLAAHTKAGHLDDALSIRAQLDILGSATVTADPDLQTNQVVGVWKYEVATAKYNSDIELTVDGMATFKRDNTKGKWSISKRTLTVSWTNGIVYTIKLPSEPTNKPVKGLDSKAGAFTITKLQP